MKNFNFGSLFFALVATIALGQSNIFPVTYYDFSGDHNDFENPDCPGGEGMVQPKLDSAHKPFHLPGDVCGNNQLQDWFRSSPDNTRYCRDLTLTPDPKTTNGFSFDNQSFFPIDDVPTNEKKYKDAKDVIHNFHFCMEMHATFKYRGKEIFDFIGDDDLWVFVNNNLALDLGGLHSNAQGNIDLDKQAESLEIVKGNFYNFDLFFCERQTNASHLKFSTSIDIVPPPTPGFHIADAKLNVLPSGDTVNVYAFDPPKIFNSVTLGNQSQTIDCSNVISQTKLPINANWSIGTTALSSVSQAPIDPSTLTKGATKIVVERNGVRDSIYIRITEPPPLSPPIADPSGRDFIGKIKVRLTHHAVGAVIHYTLDGTDPTETSPVYKDTLIFTQNATLKAIATKPHFPSSPIITEKYNKVIAKVISGSYEDQNGDGIIETATLKFNADLKNLPTEIRFTDPFNRTYNESITQFDLNQSELKVKLKNFKAGTGFTADTLAHLLADTIFDAQNILMEDKVGPIAVSANSFPANKGTDASIAFPSIDLELSESVAIKLTVLVLPLEIKRGASTLSESGITVTSIVKISDTKYRFIFATGSKYPVPGDSVRISGNHSIDDSKGNRSNMSIYIPVGGVAAQIELGFAVELTEGVTKGSKHIELPAGIDPVVIHGQNTCINCSDPGIEKIVKGIDPSLIKDIGPTWKIKTKFPFHFTFNFYDNLGQFVNQSQGDVTADRFKKLESTELVDDSVVVQLTFLPVAKNGNLIATGAYIMRGTLLLDAQNKIIGTQGEAINALPKKEEIISRFGFIRK